MPGNPVSGEVSNSKLAAVFGSDQAARAAARALQDEASLQPAQVQVVTPADTHADRKLEPESRGIWHTIVTAHVRLGIAGLVAGLVVFAVMMLLDIPFITQSPWAAAAVIASFGGVAGLLLGGLVSLRPDHDRYIHATRDAMAERRTTVVVHAFSIEQAAKAEEILAGRGGEVTRTL